MYKTYQIKWCIIVVGILTISTLLLRPDVPRDVPWWQYLNYSFRLFAILFSSWMIHGYFLTHHFTKLKSYGKYILSNVLSIVATFVVSYLIYLILPLNVLGGKEIGFSSFAEARMHLTGSFFLSLICYVVFYSTHTNSALQNSKLENEMLGQEHLRAQLISLQQQISPHFLFNSLSTLKTIATDQPTKNYVVQLASVYRYVLNFNQHYLTPLREEISFIRSYLYIMNERFEEALQVDLQISEDYMEMKVPPLSLQLLIENAIKHNMISPEQPLQITIITDATPALTVKNNFQPKKVAEEGTGIGLKNIMERYKLLSGKTVSIVQDKGEFSVTLPLLQK